MEKWDPDLHIQHYNGYKENSNVFQMLHPIRFTDSFVGI